MSRASTYALRIRYVEVKNQNFVKIDADYTIRCRMYMIETVPVLIWSETDQNKHFLNKIGKTLKKTRARRQKNQNFVKTDAD